MYYLFCFHDVASIDIYTFKSPEMLAPAKIPVAAGKKTEKTVKKVSPWKLGAKFSTNVVAMRNMKFNSFRWAWLTTIISKSL